MVEGWPTTSTMSAVHCARQRSKGVFLNAQWKWSVGDQRSAASVCILTGGQGRMCVLQGFPFSERHRQMDYV